jgi:tricorn protease-like protein
LGDSKQYGIAEIFRQSIISLKESNDHTCSFSPDGKYLFFTRNWQKNNKWYGDIYWIETSFSEWKKGIIKSN